jgi:hypothetical protein
MSPIFENQLFQEEKGALVCHLLSNLNIGPPDVGSPRFGTFRTLLIVDDVYDLETLLKKYSSVQSGVRDILLSYLVTHDHRTKTYSCTESITVNFTLTRLECGSVQTKLASTRRTLFNPASFFRHNASNSRDSGAAAVQLLGGKSQRSQSRHVCITASRCIPRVMSIVVLMQSAHSAPALTVPSIGAPHEQQRILQVVSDSNPVHDAKGGGEDSRRPRASRTAG